MSIATATFDFERCFFKINLLNTNLRSNSKIDDNFTNETIICSVEKDTLINVEIEINVMDPFQKNN